MIPAAIGSDIDLFECRNRRHLVGVDLSATKFEKLLLKNIQQIQDFVRPVIFCKYPSMSYGIKEHCKRWSVELLG